MSYKVGDQFLVEITDIADSGMGTVYYLDDIITLTDKNIDKITPYESPVGEVKPAKKQKTAHTPEDLKNRIFALSELLSSMIKLYRQTASDIEKGVEAIDLALEDNEDG